MPAARVRVAAAGKLDCEKTVQIPCLALPGGAGANPGRLVGAQRAHDLSIAPELRTGSMAEDVLFASSTRKPRRQLEQLMLHSSVSWPRASREQALGP